MPYFKENLVSFQAALPDLIAKKTTGINTTNNIAYFIYFSYLILINFNENRCVIPLQDNYTDSNFCLMLMPNRNTSKIKKSDPKASLSQLFPTTSFQQNQHYFKSTSNSNHHMKTKHKHYRYINNSMSNNLVSNSLLLAITHIFHTRHIFVKVYVELEVQSHHNFVWWTLVRSHQKPGFSQSHLLQSVEQHTAPVFV